MSRDILEVEDLGKIDAESDERLTDYFVKTSAYSIISEHRKPIVLGRKGSGKTALFIALKRDNDIQKDILIEGLSFKDYPWGAHNQACTLDVANEERFYSIRW